MPLAIRPFSEDFVSAVKEFNARLIRGGIFHEFQFHESPVSSWLPKIDGRSIYQEFFLAEEKGAVRGGYVLKHQPFSFSGEVVDLPYYHGLISEGLFDRKYAQVGSMLTRHAVKAQPLLFALGMGGWQQPLPRMLQAMRWKCFEIPFLFLVCSPFRFLREIRALRSTLLRTFVSQMAAWTGAGSLAIRAAQAFRRRKIPAAAKATAELTAEFGEWSDGLWEECRRRYALVGLRDRKTLNVLYPPENRKFQRLVVRRGSQTIGWAVLLDTMMRESKYFGNLRVGSLVDCLADPAQAAAVVFQATEYLRRRGVDLIVSNQCHEAWCDGLRRAGFLDGPSNFLFAASPQLAERLEPFGEARAQLHFTRGDGDGPIHL